jgi:hypothetical protein
MKQTMLKNGFQESELKILGHHLIKMKSNFQTNLCKTSFGIHMMHNVYRSGTFEYYQEVLFPEFFKQEI